MTPQPIHTIVLYPRPHPDNIVALYLLREFGEQHFPGIRQAQIQFWPSVPPGKTADDWEREGVLMIDIGGGKTNIAIYHHGAVRHTVVVPLGGELFTNDIAVGLRTSIPEAERLKREQGCALSSMAQEDTVFEVSGVGCRHPRAIAQSVLCDILQPRAEEIVHIVRNEIRTAGYERQAGAGVVLTGGASMLQGFVDLAEDILDMPVRIGTSTGFGESLLERMPQLMGPEFATVTGLVLYGDRRRKTYDFHESSSSGFKKFVSKFRSFL